jgi:hypothetical protein
MSLPITLTFGAKRDAIAATLLDLSRGGCFLRTEADIRLGGVATVTFVVRPAQSCTARGSVVRLQTGSGFGVRFEEANDAFRAFVRDLASLRPELRPDFVANVVSPEMRIA